MRPLLLLTTLALSACTASAPVTSDDTEDSDATDDAGDTGDVGDSASTGDSGDTGDTDAGFEDTDPTDLSGLDAIVHVDVAVALGALGYIDTKRTRIAFDERTVTATHMDPGFPPAFPEVVFGTVEGTLTAEEARRIARLGDRLRDAELPGAVDCGQPPCEGNHYSVVVAHPDGPETHAWFRPADITTSAALRNLAETVLLLDWALATCTTMPTVAITEGCEPRP